MTEDLCNLIAGVVSFWEDSTSAELIRAYPTDWQPEILYAEWLWAPYQGPGSSHYYPGRTAKKPEIYNGFSTSRDFVGPLQNLLRTVEEKRGVVIDQVVKHKDEGRISVLWHVPGQHVRKHGWAPVVAIAPLTTTQSENGVEA